MRLNFNSFVINDLKNMLKKRREMQTDRKTKTIKFKLYKKERDREDNYNCNFLYLK